MKKRPTFHNVDRKIMISTKEFEYPLQESNLRPTD